MQPVPRITLLPASGHVDMPWKNGLGRTAEIAREPPSGDGFDWRISIATIGSDGPFSAFVGCDRTLVPIAGGGLALDFEDGSTLSGEIFEPIRFAGDRPCQGRLLAGPARDLNVITRRGAARHRLEIISPSRDIATSGTTSVVIAIHGALTMAGNDALWRLGTGDALRIDGPGVALRIASDDPAARAALITLENGAG
jgi:uncharacterized protein